MGMIFRVTLKLGKKIHVAPAQCLPAAENPFLDWCATLFTVERAQYILVTNTRSLYSMVMIGRGIADDDRFLRATFRYMSDLMKDDGHESVFREIIGPQTGAIWFSKAGDRRVLGSMNDFIYQAKYYLGEAQISPFEASLRINKAPMSLLGMNSPREAFMSMSAG